MKKSDIAMIILIASISAMVAYFVVGAIPGMKDANKPVKVDTIERYSADLKEPDSQTFSKDAINPTVEVTIGGNNRSD